MTWTRGSQTFSNGDPPIAKKEKHSDPRQKCSNSLLLQLQLKTFYIFYLFALSLIRLKNNAFILNKSLVSTILVKYSHRLKAHFIFGQIKTGHDCKIMFMKIAFTCPMWDGSGAHMRVTKH